MRRIRVALRNPDSKPLTRRRVPSRSSGGPPLQLDYLMSHQRTRLPTWRLLEARPPALPLRMWTLARPQQAYNKSARARRYFLGLPPPKRAPGLRHHRPHGSGILHAVSRSTAGQLRLRRRDSAPPPCATRSAAAPALGVLMARIARHGGLGPNYTARRAAHGALQSPTCSETARRHRRRKARTSPPTSRRSWTPRSSDPATDAPLGSD